MRNIVLSSFVVVVVVGCGCDVVGSVGGGAASGGGDCGNKSFLHFHSAFSHGLVMPQELPHTPLYSPFPLGSGGPGSFKHENAFARCAVAPWMFSHKNS